MSDEVEYLPPQYGEILDNGLERKKQIDAERKNKLTPQQAIFVNHLLEANMDVSIAAQRTGVEMKKAREWVEMEGPVSDKIVARLIELEQKSKVTVDTITAQLWEEATRMPVDTDDKTVSHAARVSALSHLARYKGMFDKAMTNQPQKVVVNIDIGGDATVTGGTDE